MVSADGPPSVFSNSGDVEVVVGEYLSDEFRINDKADLNTGCVK